ncbi:MAG: hypothetical protein EAZ53_12090 [Bacteroidetes bacterium]|nr:MAG: hypothetical protein EAZ53_12090 [Bacteroidota bacterium]
MIDFINKNVIKIFLGILIAVILFHFSIILKIIPYSITWGGRLQNDSEMYIFETISILINVFLCLILLMKGNFLKYKFSNKSINIVLWIFFGVFVLNTIGNIFAKTNFEKMFSILTALFSVLLWIILRKSNEG